MGKVRLADDQYATTWEGPLGVLLEDRDLPISSSERQRGRWPAAHVAARYSIAVRDPEGDEIIIRHGQRYYYNPKHSPTDEPGLARDILECVGMDFAYDNEYWPDSDDAEEVALCVLAYVRDMGEDIPDTEDGVREMIRSHREPGRIYREAVRVCGDEDALVEAAQRLREQADEA